VSATTTPATSSEEELERILLDSTFFSTLDGDARSFISEHLTPRTVPGGTVLMRQGDEADGLFLVAVGRLRVSMERDDGSTVVLAELGRGQVVGELALITDEPRSATVTAVRDSQVLTLSSESYELLVREHPNAFRQLASQVVRRLVRSLQEGTRTSPVVTIAVVPLCDDNDVAMFAGRLHASVARLTDAAAHVSEQTAVSALGNLENVTADRLASWFAGHDAGYEVVVYDAAGTSAWAESCVRQADLVLLVVTARATPELRPVERLISERRLRLQCRMELVLVHPPGTQDPRGTARWLAPRDIDRHHHVRSDRTADVDRAARLLLGHGIGVVFSGGGARGVAGIGALRAIEELGVPIDAVGGTSIGSLVGGGAARAETPEQIAAQLRAAVLESSPFDFTFPAVSLASGKRVTERIAEAADGLDLEDTWRRFFCISTNLTQGNVEIHRRGPGWYAVRSSFSIPGLFPPVRTPTGELLVDGGVLNNLPVRIMRAEHYGIKVIAVDVGRVRDVTAGSLPHGGVMSGWRLLLGRLDPATVSQTDTAGLGRILMRLTELGTEQTDDLGDVYIRPDVGAFGIADFKAFDRLVELGYESAHAAITTWLASGDAPRF
jgi:predicted acylesterase/phospholipase RssA/CRP-like cAMP-binding protein